MPVCGSLINPSLVLFPLAFPGSNQCSVKCLVYGNIPANCLAGSVERQRTCRDQGSWFESPDDTIKYWWSFLDNKICVQQGLTGTVHPWQWVRNTTCLVNLSSFHVKIRHVVVALTEESFRRETTLRKSTVPQRFFVSGFNLGFNLMIVCVVECMVEWPQWRKV